PISNFVKDLREGGLEDLCVMRHNIDGTYNAISGSGAKKNTIDFRWQGKENSKLLTMHFDSDEIINALSFVLNERPTFKYRHNASSFRINYLWKANCETFEQAYNNIIKNKDIFDLEILEDGKKK
ncbi:MAG: hypothetical protein PHQ86_06915, partial [Dehalococcoidales bacterium]|nr:hypothetical protein [Dehalococcoidales bacterium]